MVDAGAGMKAELIGVARNAMRVNLESLDVPSFTCNYLPTCSLSFRKQAWRLGLLGASLYNP